MEQFSSRIHKDLAEKEFGMACRKLFYDLHTADNQMLIKEMLLSLGSYAWRDYQAAEMALLNLKIVSTQEMK